MAFKEQNPEAWNNLIKGNGYICPDCGNQERFQQYWHIVKDVRQNPETGIIEWVSISYDVMEGTHPLIADTICSECGSSVLICKKGVLLDTLCHENYDEHIAKYTHENTNTQKSTTSQ